MAYIPPSTANLLASIKLINKQYQPSSKKRKDTLTLSNTLVHLIKHYKTPVEHPDLQQLLTAIFFICRESIGLDYKFSNPQFKIGKFYSTGSKLYDLYSKALNISKTNPVANCEILVYLEKFYNFIFNTKKTIIPYDAEKLNQLLEENELDITFVRKQTIQILNNSIRRLAKDIDQIIEAIPTEETMSKKMATMQIEYVKLKTNNPVSFFSPSSVNSDRKFHVQLLEAISQALSIQQNKDLSADEMSRSQRIKMGALIYIMESISHEKKYWLRSPQNSMLYSICADISNLSNPHTLPKCFKLDLLCTFKRFLNDSTTINFLEAYALQHFKQDNYLRCLEIKISVINKKIDMINNVLIDDKLMHWPVTHSMGQVLALVFAAPGYGLGYNVGHYISNINDMVKPKNELGIGVSKAMAYLGLSGSAMGFLAADFLINSTFTRLFAKVLELLGVIIGCTTGYAIGFTVDLTYKGLRHICECFLHLHDKLTNEVSLIKQTDVAFVQSLLNLPPQILTYVQQDKIKKMAEENFVNLGRVIN